MEQQKRWWKEAVGYQIYLKSFFDTNGDGVGDIKGVTEKLDYIRNLGVNFIWVSPFYDSPMDDNGYDIRDYKKVMQEYGTIDDVKNMIKKAHSIGLKVIIDMVLNHTSSEHEWFIKSIARATEYDDYYYWADGIVGKDGKLLPPNNWESFFGGSAWKYNKERGQYFLRIFSEKMPDINYNSKKAMQNMQDTMEFWVGLGVDGFRLDAISHIGKEASLKNGKVGKTFKQFSNLDSAHTYLKSLIKNLDKNNFVTMGELGGGPTVLEQLKYSGENRDELNMVFEFSHLNCKDDKTGEIKYNQIIKSLKNKEKVSCSGGWSALFWTNHDYQRLASMYGDKRALSKSCSAFAVAMYLLKGTPIIYQGEELGMTGYDFKSESEFEDVNAKTLLSLATDEEKPKVLELLIRTSRDNARTIMQWNGSVNAGFSEGKPWFVLNKNYHSINVAVEQVEEHSCLNEYKRIIELRKANKDAFCYGDVKFKKSPKGIIRYLRNTSGQEFDVIVNLTDEVKKYELPAGEIVYTNYGEVVRGELSPFEAVVLKRKTF